jgi:hypothetical protein
MRKRLCNDEEIEWWSKESSAEGNNSPFRDYNMLDIDMRARHIKTSHQTPASTISCKDAHNTQQE